MLETFAYHPVTVVHFTDQNSITATLYCIRCVLGLQNLFDKLKLKNRTFSCVRGHYLLY